MNGSKLGWIGIGLALGVGVSALAYVLAFSKEKTPMAPPAAGTGKAPGKQGGTGAKDGDRDGAKPSHDGADGDVRRDSTAGSGVAKASFGDKGGRGRTEKGVLESGPVRIERPPIKPGDNHDWKICAAEHEAFVVDHLRFPDLYIPAKPALGRNFIVRFPDVVGLHLHLLGENDVNLATIWPEEKTPEALSAAITPDVRIIEVVVPPAVQYYSYAQDGSPANPVVIPPEVLTFRVGKTEASALPASCSLGEAGLAGYYQVSPVGQNWFALGLYEIRALSFAQLQLAGVTLPPVLTAGIEHQDKTVTWWFILPWPQNMAIEQVMPQPMDLLVGVAGEHAKKSIVLPVAPKGDISIRPPHPVGKASVTATYFGTPGEQYHMGLFVWPEPGDEKSEAKIAQKTWEFKPAKPEDKVKIEVLEVGRQRTGWEQRAVLALRHVRMLPQ